MKLITYALIIQFLISCWPKTNIVNKIRQQYGLKTLAIFRKLEKTLFKLKKVDLDIQFMLKCFELDMVPKFCRIKLPNDI